MRDPKRMTRQELETVVVGLIQSLYEQDGMLNPEKEWDADVLESIGLVIYHAGLRPDSVVDVDKWLKEATTHG